ncbi:MAG: class I adenylate-forming enzyme family protein, partial [Gammaproteobacteria bacterium]|nr:class I adenylate-forming enzyme family protein [Gammaproteobacteria bacterium]
LSHINGVVTTVLAPLITGGTVVFYQGTFAVDLFLELLQRCRATWINGNPTHYQLLAYVSSRPPGFDACRFARSASAPLKRDVQQQFEHVFGIPIIETMGLTECAGQVFANPMATAHRRFGSVGRPVGNDAQVVNDQDEPVADGETGEIRVKGPNVMTGYLRDLEGTAEVLRDEWLYTGDLGYRDKDGFFFITGRKKLIAIFSGTNISLVAVEQAALQVEGIEESAAVAREHASFGEVIDLYYTGGGEDPDRCERDIREQLLRVLPHHLAMGNIERINSLPRSPSGKLLRFELSAK